MLVSLSIKNYALIDDVRVNFDHSLNIITGETGAGKSIILGALGLIIGDRADLSSLRQPDQKCIVEASFDISLLNLQQLFEENDLDFELNTIIRREILATGKSRAFINDTPVKLQTLQQIGSQLIDIHSQHQTRTLAETSYQYEIVDALAATKAELEAFKLQSKQLKKIKHKLNLLIEKEGELQKGKDFNTFLLEELEQAKLSELNLEELESEQLQLSNVEAIKQQLSFATNAMQEDSYGIIQQVNEIFNRIQKISSFSEDYILLQQRFDSVRIELEDLSFEVDKLNNNLEDDPKQLEFIEEKLQQVYRLQKKHQVETIQELIQIEHKLADEVFETEHIYEEIKKLQKQVNLENEKLQKIGEQLYEKRKAVLPSLIQQTKAYLNALSMPDVQFDFEIRLTEEQNSFGMDEMNWKFSANKGSLPKPIGKIASGGELSRLVLALKYVLAEYKKLPTIVFDEIDTGVSGEVALRIGNLLVKMGELMQVISITHLPQIASKGKLHLKVYKQDINGKTTTQLKALEKEERIIEIAEMLGGDSTSSSAIAHSKTLFEE